MCKKVYWGESSGMKLAKGEESRAEKKELWLCNTASSEDSVDPKGSSGVGLMF